MENKNNLLNSNLELRNLPDPQSAWILLGDEKSYPILQEKVHLDSRPSGEHSDINTNVIGRLKNKLRQVQKWWAGEEPFNWTAAKHIELGDTLFFYFLTPYKAIHFVGRAVSRPYFDSKSRVMSIRKVNRHQWWIDYSAIVEIEPIPYNEINSIFDDKLILRGRSGKPIPSKIANQLLKRSRIVDTFKPWYKNVSLHQVKGISKLPTPANMNLEKLRDIPASLLPTESQVEEYIVEPLYCLLGLPAAYELKRRFNIKSKIADYAVLKNSLPHCIIETKLRTKLDHIRNWSKSPDIKQAQGYANNFNVGFIVIDCDEIFCFNAGSLEPKICYERRKLTIAGITAIRKFVIESN